MKFVSSDEDDVIAMTVWVKRGSMRVNRDCLDVDDPDHPYNYIQGLGKRPEDYGYFRPPEFHCCPKCGHKFKDEIDEIPGDYGLPSR